jgi:ribulose-5-phosphate 4-epimerase/fuculose-1-phosphate aldolase
LTASDELSRAIDDVVAANRILAHEGVVDAYGHVSMRHPHEPSRYLLSRSRSPELVERGDIATYMLDGTPVGDDRAPYVERFIHGGIYEARPEINAVVHSHAEDVLPYTITDAPLRPLVHVASYIGANIPVWDIADRFGDTNLLVRNVDQGRDLAQRLGAEPVALMRGHGFAAAGRSLFEAVRIAIYLPLNARVHTIATIVGKGKMRPLSDGEIAVRSASSPLAPEAQRAWEYWKQRAGVS